jgi:ribonuclease P protein component
MNNSRATFPKNERLSRKLLIETLFQKGLSFVAYPLRIIYLPVENAETTHVGALLAAAPNARISILISIPKKKIKHAVDRNYIKRRIRESYRLRKHDLIRSFSEKDQKLLLAFIYMDTEKSSFEKIDKAMDRTIQTLKQITE